MEELKDCPFCLGPAQPEDTETGYKEIVCQVCGNRTRGWVTTGMAADKWNKRPPNTQIHMDKDPCENCPEWERLKHDKDPWLIHCPTCGRALSQ